MQHQGLAKERWFQLNLAEQLGNLGSEISRCASWQDKDQTKFQGAVERALELFDLTLQDKRWDLPKRKEIARARELFAANVLGGENYATSLSDLDNYFLPFALLTRSASRTPKLSREVRKSSALQASPD